MANRNFKPNGGTLEERVVTLFGQAVIGASGAVSSFKGVGITSFVKTATAGQYTITLDDSYNALLDVTAKVVLGTISAVSPGAQILLNPTGLTDTFNTSKQITVQFTASGVATNPDSGASILVRVEVRNSTVGPKYS